MATADRSNKNGPFDLATEEGRERFERFREKWRKKVEPLMRASRKSEAIIEVDLRKIINAKAN